jgi:hypothetical protein
MTCKSCGERFSSRAACSQHYGKGRACLNPCMVPSLEPAKRGGWKHHWMDYGDYQTWQRERLELSRLEPDDFAAWSLELADLDTP